MTKFYVPGRPVPWARPRKRGGKPLKKRFFNTPEHENHMTLVQVCARNAMRGRPLIDRPVLLSCLFFFPWPKGTSEKAKAESRGIMMVARPDTSNLVKLVEDACNNVVWRDDSLVHYAAILKVRTDLPPMTKVTVMLVDDEAAVVDGALASDPSIHEVTCVQ
ncbi:MAG: RusA family crossover junction endodeoxyribonuclease [Devosia sp.]